MPALLADVPRYHATPEIRVECPDAVKFSVVAEVGRRLGAEYEVIDIDGARVQFPQGWGLIRASNTQLALVLRADAHSQRKGRKSVAPSIVQSWRSSSSTKGTSGA